MRTIILAGGDGKRLRPVTCTMPKPLVPLLNKPILFYTLELLKKHGFCDVAVTLGYMGEAIKKAVGGGERFGLDVKYRETGKRLGTAGSAKAALGDDKGDTALIIYGDCMTDFDLASALKAHKASRAAATLLLKKVERPTEYGIALTDNQGFITGFLEKPSPGQVFSDKANTGVYFIEPRVFDSMPENTELDFSKDIFPKLLASGEKLLGIEMSGYWSDIGCPEELCRTQRDMLLGRCSFVTDAIDRDGVFMEPGANVSPKAKLIAPCYIGRGAEIGAYACADEFSVICSGVKLEEDSSVKRSVVLEGAAVRQGAEVRGAIVCENAELAADSAAFEGAVIGAGSLVERGAAVCPGVLVWPYKTVEQGEKCRANVSWGSGRPLKAEGSAFIGSGDRLITPEKAVRIAAAYAAGFDLPAELVIGCDGKAASVMLKYAIASGCASQGAEAMLSDHGSRYAFAAHLRHLGAAGGLYAFSAENECITGIRLYDGRGVEADANTVRAVENALRFGEQQPETHGELGVIRSVGGADMCIWADIGRAVDTRILAENPSHLIINAPHEVCRDVAAFVLRYGWSADCVYDCKRLLQAPDKRTVSILIDDNERVSCMISPELAFDSCSLLAAIAEDLGQPRVMTPLDFDPALEEYLRAKGVSCEPGPEYAEARRRAAMTSGVYVPALLEPVVIAVKACELFVKGSLERAAEELPRCCRRSAEYRVPASRAAAVMGGIASEAGEVNGVLEGIRLKNDTGWVTVRPCPERASFRVVAGSMNAEYAGELCDIYLEKLKKLRSKS